MPDLSGIRELADERGDHTLSAAVPGDVQSALEAAGLISDRRTAAARASSSPSATLFSSYGSPR